MSGNLNTEVTSSHKRKTPDSAQNAPQISVPKKTKFVQEQRLNTNENTVNSRQLQNIVNKEQLHSTSIPNDNNNVNHLNSILRSNENFPKSYSITNYPLNSKSTSKSSYNNVATKNNLLLNQFLQQPSTSKKNLQNSVMSITFLTLMKHHIKFINNHLKSQSVTP